MEYKNLLVEKEDHICYVWINREQHLNMFDLEIFDELWHLQEELFEDLKTRVIVLGAKGKLFSAGLDLKNLQSGTITPQWASRMLQKMQEYHNRWERMPIPMISMIHGTCIGGGVEISISADIRVAGKSAQFSLPEINMGFSPDMGATQRLTRLIGPGQAKYMIMTGDFIDADEALRIGLVDFLVPDEELEEFTRKMARKIASKPPLAVGVAKKAINISTETSTFVGQQFEQLGSCFLFGTEDFNEGPKAFFEKRKPNFKGK